jgi:long-chain acyl-CoA synthetase
MNVALPLLTRALQHPSAPAVTADGQTATFADLAGRVARIAVALREAHGVRQGDRILLWMENSREFIEALFACWAAGACAVPVNAKLHIKEARHILQDSGARLAFASASLLDGADGELGIDRRCLFVAGTAEFESLASGPPAAFAPMLPTDPAWIFYTSGTTGFPKGAILTHRNLLFMAMTYYADIERVESGSTMIHAAPLSHGSGQYMLPHLLGGGHQVILRKFDAAEIVAAFAAYPAVSIFAVPTMVNRLVQAADGRTDPAGNLRTIIYGGAPMYVADLRKAMEVFGPRFFQLYGQGETPMTTTGLTKREHAGDFGEAHLAKLGTSGVPRTGVEVRIVDADGADLPAGEPGEIVTRSDCVMAGYWNNPSATASALREGWLWTGDIGSMDAAGYLTLRDRSKDMVISGGSNIYPREIEEVLLRHPGVVECSIVARPHPDLGEEPVAFVVRRDPPGATEAELDALCLKHIARFKRPRAYRFVDALPKSAYGKILKTDLREMLRRETQH